jgi:hypothetical protein
MALDATNTAHVTRVAMKRARITRKCHSEG